MNLLVTTDLKGLRRGGITGVRNKGTPRMGEPLNHQALSMGRGTTLVVFVGILNFLDLNGERGFSMQFF
jgi:hypothetical protein